MNKYDYKNELDKIKCSPEFRAEMTELLLKEADSDYADSVDHVEKAPKINYYRSAALAASAVIVIGMGVGVFLHLSKLSIDTPITDLSNNDSSTASTEIADENELSSENTSFENVNEIVYNMLDDTISEKYTKLAYHTGQGQYDSSMMLENINGNDFIEVLMNFDWYSEDNTFPTGGFFAYGNMLFTTKGEIYDCSSGEMYSVGDQDAWILENFLTTGGDIENLKDIFSSVNNGHRNLSGDVISYYSVIDDPYLVLGGQGRLYYDMENADVYMKLEMNEFESEKNIGESEFYIKDNKCIQIEKGENVDEYISPDLSENGRFTLAGKFDNEDPLPTISDIIEEAIEHPDFIEDFICVNNEGTTEAVLSLENESERTVLQLEIDENGAIVHAFVRIYSFETHSTPYYFEFYLSNYTFDSDEFNLPDPSQDIMDEFTLAEYRGFF